MALTREQRTANILAKFRDLPGEFYMLKGLLCLPAATCPPSDDVEHRMSYEARRKEERTIEALYDTLEIAKRMDEINAEIFGK